MKHTEICSNVYSIFPLHSSFVTNVVVIKARDFVLGISFLLSWHFTSNDANHGTGCQTRAAFTRRQALSRPNLSKRIRFSNFDSNETRRCKTNPFLSLWWNPAAFIVQSSSLGWMRTAVIAMICCTSRQDRHGRTSSISATIPEISPVSIIPQYRNSGLWEVYLLMLPAASGVAALVPVCDSVHPLILLMFLPSVQSVVTILRALPSKTQGPLSLSDSTNR